MRNQLTKILSQTLGIDPSEVQLMPTKETKFGDYQCNAAMAAAKKLGMNPRQLASDWQAKLTPALEGIARLEIAGPGFLNLFLEDSWVEQQLRDFQPTRWETGLAPRRVLVEYSSPNVAKEMHVGHIRSTILGDAVARVMAFAGNEVIRQNHLGDWGTQFGMLCTHVKDHPELAHSDLSSIDQLYKEASARFQSDEDFEKRARQAVVALHQGDSETLQLWEQVVEQSRRHFQPLYQRLGVLLTRADERGESFYRHQLGETVEWLQSHFAEPKNGLQVTVSDGAVCAYHWKPNGEPEFLNAQKEAQPFLIRKSDGAFLYATTDLAACRFRVDQLKADTIIVITDARQVLHFQMLIATVKRAGWLHTDRGEVDFQHLTFGSILGPDRKPFKARSGETVKLAELLDEAVERARTALTENPRSEFSEEEIQSVSEAIGIGAVKYADLAQYRGTDYIFSWDKMLSLEGNTAPYMLYALARIRSILGKANFEAVDARLEHPQERALAIQLLRFHETLDVVIQDWRLNLLADYLYQVAGAFSRFYEECPVLKSEEPQRSSRLRLCDTTARVLEQGLTLLGIPLVERM